MRYLTLFLLIGCPSLLFAQQKPYQLFEVDSVAEPRGGQAYFNVFIQTNLRKPIQAEALGIGGRVMLTGVAETDGSVSDIKVLTSLRPDCDREAIRVLSLFKAWKPASKGGKPVRQIVNMPIVFKANEPFTYLNGNRISYFDNADKLITDSTQAAFRQVIPLDTNGLPSNDIVLYRLRSKSWKEERRLPFVREKYESGNKLKQRTYRIGYQDAERLWQGMTFSLTSDGRLLEQTYYEHGRPKGPRITYHPNGLVAEKSDEADTKRMITAWYTTGQIKLVREIDSSAPLGTRNPERLSAYWDSTGNQQVKDGNGLAVFRETVRSYADTTRQTSFIEQGIYQNRLKQGIWTGRYADGSYFYEEIYDKGICQKGKARTIGKDTVQYSVPEQLPEFRGGMPALGQFLSQTLHYPPAAQRAKVQGRVFISFVINKEGEVEDVEVLKGIGFGTDEEAVRVVKASSGRWVPGAQRGQNIKVKYNLPINFSLQ
ncbi:MULTISPECIES: energy transducer TonB [unclassified Spirosoma]|uniref:energy transducer TonB n=1 Tax=unclassified Spirosoma TaxID=2621999 RepID=UPI0009681C7B|nr:MULTISPECIES: energy transducer TonB [unclassified Spirosoma]MBN8821659.1 energy transducer TonB [Spirosoma sp.]OJW80844.1 MAG: energy transducer TonB [Spirosoma sp. 48-14]